MRTIGMRLGLGLAALAVVAVTDGRPNRAGAIEPARRKLLSELPEPKAGDKLKVLPAEIKTKANDDGMLDVTEIVVPAGAGDEVVLPPAQWELDVDGWFDDEGLNLTAIYPRSGLWSMRRSLGGSGAVKPATPPPGGMPPGAGPVASPLITDGRPKTQYADSGDVITHVNRVPVTSYERLVYAINSAPNKRDLPIVLMNGKTGRKQLLYVTAHKSMKL